jgi:hypothetical protein
MVETDRFLAKADSGKEYVVIQYQDYIDVSTHDNPNSKILSRIKRLETEDGLLVTYIDEKTFSIFDTGEIIRKV